MARFVPLLFAASALVLLVVSCQSKDKAGTGGAPSGSAAAAVQPGTPSASASAADEDEVRPVYPVDNSPPNPLAQKLCTALHETPASRKAECCKSVPGTTVTSECVRTLSAAMRLNTVAIEEADVNTCLDAMERAYAGCDWVGLFTPPPPTECTTIVKGKLAAGAVCRSNLECASNLRCHGLGPTMVGRCGPPSEAGAGCGGSVDSLASFTRQDTKVDELHPQCKGFCARRVCAEAPPDGTPCKASPQCGPKHACVAGKCSAAAPGKVGEPCVGGLCEGDLICSANKCVAKKKAGETCSNEFECQGGCLRPDGGATGVCGMKCDVSGAALHLGAHFEPKKR